MSDPRHVGPGTGPGSRDPNRRLADRLVADLRPVRRLMPPAVRTGVFLAVVFAATAALASMSNLAAMRDRLMAAPDMWLAVLGSTVTAIFAAIAAFQLGLPDRSRLWALLPVPPLALWVAASGMGCARTWPIPGVHDASWDETRSCLAFIIGLSIPLSLLLMLMLRRAYTLSPTLTAAMAGLAAAASAATLLNFFHPYDATVDDLLVHACGVVLVVLANRAFGSRLLRKESRLPEYG